MDGLTSLLDGPRGRGAFLQRTVMEPPWSFRMADDAPLGLVAVLQGTAWIVPDAGEAREVGIGSVSLVRALTPVTLASAPGVRFATGARRTGCWTGAGVSPRTWRRSPRATPGSR